MKFHDYCPSLGLSLVTDDDGTGWRYEALAPLDPLQDTPGYLLRQGHYVANAIPQGLVIVGKRIELIPADWARKAGRDGTYMTEKAE